jgi:soluble lytic murein transglycosylase-like protein
MKKQVSIMTIAGMALFVLSAPSSRAEDKFKQVVMQDGRKVFTNVIEDTPLPLAAVATVPNSISDPINALIEVISRNLDVDPALVRAMVKAESNFNRWAISSKGALGLMQLIPETGARYGVRDFFDPQQNIEGGVRYIKFLLGKFNGNLDLSLAAYNAGENLVDKIGRIPAIRETQDYVRKVRANYYGKASSSVAAASVRAPGTAPRVPAKQEQQQIFRTVDERGVIHLSNVAPPR